MARETVSVNRTIGAPIDRVWATVSAIGGLEQWFPIIETCTVEGSGVGARRICGLAGGAVLNETVETIDHAAKRFQYTIDDGSPLPVSGYVGTVSLIETDGGTALDWTAEFEVDAAQRDGTLAMLRGALGDGAEGMAKALEAG